MLICKSVVRLRGLDAPYNSGLSHGRSDPAFLAPKGRRFLARGANPWTPRSVLSEPRRGDRTLSPLARNRRPFGAKKAESNGRCPPYKTPRLDISHYKGCPSGQNGFVSFKGRDQNGFVSFKGRDQNGFVSLAGEFRAIGAVGRLWNGVREALGAAKKADSGPGWGLILALFRAERVPRSRVNDGPGGSCRACLQYSVVKEHLAR
jgi:hypothetical protein